MNIENEKIKRRYFRVLGGAEGLSPETINIIENAIFRFEESTQFKDFGSFSIKQAENFKIWLSEKKKVSVSTQFHCLRHVKNFFKWLAGQQGYKTKITLDSISFLTMDRKKTREALAPKPRRHPSLEYVLRLTESIRIDNEIDRRDRALIAFLLESGMRYTAICSLSIGCFNRETLTICQDPRLGVKTKMGKVIITHLLKFDPTLTDYIIEWADYLKNVKSFEPADPLFPRNKVEQVSDGYSFCSTEVEPAFWQGGNSIREILKKRAENAGLEYYNPHSFRHGAIHLALKSCSTPEQLKAVSQSIGHEHMTTTLRSYGTLDDQRVSDVIAGIDFTEKPGKNAGQIPIDELAKFIKKFNKKT